MRAEIQKAIEAGMANPDPAIQTKWAALCQNGSPPTPEELIVPLAKQVKMQSPANGILFPFKS